MEAISTEVIAAVLVGVLTMIWWWNELRFVLPVKMKLRGTGIRLPSGNMGLPFFGEMLTFLWYFKIVKRPDEFIDSKRRKYGDGVGLYRSHLFGEPTIIAYLPAVTRFVFQKDETFSLGWPSLELVGPTSLVSVHGSDHTRLRRFLTKAINSPVALARIASLVQPNLTAALQSMANSGRVNAYKQVKQVTFENIGRLFASLEAGPELNEIDDLFKGVTQGLRAVPLNLPGTAYHHALQCRKKVTDFFRKVLEKRKEMDGSAMTTMDDQDLMDGLRRIEDENGNRMSDEEVLDNIVSFVVAGYESTSLASMWSFYYLAKYPDVLAKLREENMALRKNKAHGEFITSDDVSKLKYTNKVVEETIRMANIAALVFRMATEDVDYKGYRFPKNWKVAVWIRYLHTNPENYDDPMCFNPDRWDKAPTPGSYQVFGGGSRICAGNMLARIQLALFLHHLSTGYKWKLINPDAPMIYLSHPILMDGVEISIAKI
ncbi:Ent-kaurenoic acid oxidase [Linum grandiflorum]